MKLKYGLAINLQRAVKIQPLIETFLNSMTSFFHFPIWRCLFLQASLDFFALPLSNDRSLLV
jgi:hypothetical protein